MNGRRAYERALRELAAAHGGVLRHGGKHLRLCLPGGVVLPASPSRLGGGRPVPVAAELRRGRTA